MTTVKKAKKAVKAMKGTRVKYTKGDQIFYVCAYSIVGLLALIVLLPMMFVVSASFSAGSAVVSGKVWILPVDFTLYNYESVLKYKNVWIGYRNTIFYTGVGTALNIVVTLLCAYPLARKNLKGRALFTGMFTFTMIFSGGMIPSYLLIRDLGLMNSVWVMIIPGAMSVYNMIITRTFIQGNIPEELLEASKLDGCNDTQFFFKIVLPLSKAIIAVLGIYYAVGHWNSYFNAFLYLTKQNLYPLQIFLRQILLQNNFDTDMLDEEMLAQMQNLQDVLKYAIIVISTAPLMFIYPFVQKYFVKGVTIGSVKG